MHKTSKERHQIAIEKDLKLEMVLRSPSAAPSQAARRHMEDKPYTYPKLSKRVREFIKGQREQRKRRERKV